MAKLPKPPAEVPLCRDVSVLAPKFRAALIDRVFPKMVAKGWQPIVLETQRSDERARFLYGFGRDYDDGRGIVTNVPTATKGWHFYCLAADVGDQRYPDGAPEKFYHDLGEVAEDAGLTSGSDWNRNDIADEHFCDEPHVQWWIPGMHVSPTAKAADLYASGGLRAVWRALRAD